MRGKTETVPAGDVRVGDIVATSLGPSTVTRVEEKAGGYAPTVYLRGCEDGEKRELFWYAHQRIERRVKKAKGRGA